MENSTKFPIFLLKVIGQWELGGSKKKSLKFLHFLYKTFIFSLLSYGVYIVIESIVDFKFEMMHGLADYYKHLSILFTVLLVILVILESFVAKNEWEIILREFEKVEMIFTKMNFETQKLSSFKTLLISMPVLVFVGNWFLNKKLDLRTLVKIYNGTNLFFTNYATTVLFNIYCWNVKNQYRNLILYVNEIRTLMTINKSKVCAPQIHKSLEIFDQLSMINSKARKFFVLRISTITGNLKCFKFKL